jgi:hypothetical protein
MIEKFQNLPIELFNKIISYVENIDIRIYFNQINKININKYQTLNSIFDQSKKCICNYHITTPNFRMFRFLKISESKCYKIIYNNDLYYDEFLIQTNIIDSNNPLFEYCVGTVFIT